MKSHHLLDIPDLPIGAFEHCGNRKIKLFGPAAAVVNAVADTANAVADTASSVVNTVSNVASSAVNVAAKVVDSVVTSAVNDPIGTVAKVATAVVAPELLPAVTAADALAHGASPTQALTQAAVSYAGGQVGNAVTSNLTAPTDAALAPDNIDIGGGYNPATGASSAAPLASATVDPLVAKMAGSAASGATQAALNGQNPVTGAEAGAINSGVNGLIGNGVTINSTSGGNPTDTTSPLSSTDVNTAPLDTSLTSGAQSNIGIQATPDTSSNLNVLATPSTTDGATYSPSSNISSMGGGQGATITTDQGTTGALGTTATNASPNLGNPNSIINNPDVLGTSVAPTDTSTNISLPKINAAAALGIGAAKPLTNAFTMPTGGLNTAGQTTNTTTPSWMQPLSATPQFIKGTAMPKKAFSLAQLQQIYNNLDPELARLIAPHGVVNSTVQPEQAPETYQQYMEANDPSLLGSETKLMADGGSAFKTDVDPLTPKINVSQSPMLHPSGQHQMIKASPLAQMSQNIGRLTPITQHLAHGGDLHKYEEAAPEGHHPEFITGLTGYYAHGGGTGQSDDIPAMLHDGDYVADADLVAALGDGSSKAGAQALEHFRRSIPHHEGASGHPVPAQIADGEYVFPANFVTAIGHGDNKAGAKLLDKMREEVRAHKRSAPDTKIPPKAKSPLEYLKMAMKG